MLNPAETFALVAIAIGVAVALFGIFFYRSRFADHAHKSQTDMLKSLHASVKAQRETLKPLKVKH